MQPADPALLPAPVRRNHRIETVLHRNLPCDGPPDVAAGIADNKILRRNAHRSGDIERLVYVERHLQRDQVQVQRLGIVCDPADRDIAVGIVDPILHRTPYRLADFINDRLSVPDLYRFAPDFELTVAVGCAVGARLVTGPQQHGIRPVAITVRVTPGYIAVAAGRDEWRARQRHAGYVSRILVRYDQPGLVPDIRYVVPQVHVIRHERTPRPGQSPADDPVVTAIQVALTCFPCRWRLFGHVTY